MNTYKHQSYNYRNTLFNYNVFVETFWIIFHTFFDMILSSLSCSKFSLRRRRSNPKYEAATCSRSVWNFGVPQVNVPGNGWKPREVLPGQTTSMTSFRKSLAVLAVRLHAHNSAWVSRSMTKPLAKWKYLRVGEEDDSGICIWSIQFPLLLNAHKNFFSNKPSGYSTLIRHFEMSKLHW